MNHDSTPAKDDFREIWSCLATIRGSAQLAKRSVSTERATPQLVSSYLTSVIEHVDLLSLRLAVMESRERRHEGEDRVVDEAETRVPGETRGTMPKEDHRHNSGLQHSS